MSTERLSQPEATSPQQTEHHALEGSTPFTQEDVDLYQLDPENDDGNVLADEGGASGDGGPDIASITSSATEKFISKIAEDLIDKLCRDNIWEKPRRSLDELTIERIAGKLERLLKAFALKIGHTRHDGTETQINRDIMVFVYKNARGITQMFIKNCRRQSGDCSSSNGVFDTKKDNSLGIAPHEKFDWCVGDDIRPGEIPPDFANGSNNIYRYRDPNAENGEDSDTQACDSDSDGKVFVRIDGYYNFLSGTTAYWWLLSSLRRERDLIVPADPNIMVGINETIISSLPSHPITRKASSKTYRISFEVDWNPQGFVREQGCEEESGKVIGMALTLTGSIKDAQVLNCAQYLAQTWPSSGKQIFQLIQDVVRSGVGNRDLPDNTTLVARIHGSKLIAEASGAAYSLAEIGEQLAWLGAALRCPPEKVAVVYCKPEIVPTTANASISPFWDRCYNLDFKFHSKLELSSPYNGYCWLNLFSDPVVVEGYPISTRPEYNTGLEISLNTAADLIGAQYTTVLGGRIFVKGFCAMLTLARHVGDVFIWRLITTEDESHVDYSDHGFLRPPPYDTKIIDLAGLQRARNIVGWCQDIGDFTEETNVKSTDHRTPRDPLPKDAIANSTIDQSVYTRRRRSWNVWSFIAFIVILAKGVGVFFLFAWFLFLSPAHIIRYTLLGLWTENLDHPPQDLSEVVYDPGNTSIVDVFAIHSLDSDPSSAWRYRENETDVYWLYDILPKQAGLEKIRVTVLNHRLRWQYYVPDFGLDAYAQGILDEIKLINQGNRPIIFIAHGFGGLLLKQALVLDNKQSRKITSKTKGILFLGVPHYGTKVTFLVSLLLHTAYWLDSPTTLLEYMVEGNPSLKAMENDFYEVCVRPSWKLSMDMPYIGNFMERGAEQIRRWSLGPIMNLQSRRLYYARNELLDTDHHELNKFQSSSDPKFRTFLTHFNCAMARATNDESTYDLC
ncbi:hypothetical protein GGR51DRAFT_572596 [Nemania sp. FL0031]|nr:hypothetical protein GGR51DRAFT_572596 [Nemania sp. FL0031]